jgi:hypothetical protein
VADDTVAHDEARVFELYLNEAAESGSVYLAKSVLRHPGLDGLIKTTRPKGREAVLALALLAVRTRASALRSRSAGPADEPVRLEGSRKPHRTPASSLYDGLEKGALSGKSKCSASGACSRAA